MKIKLIIFALLFVSMTQIYASVTEKLAANSDKISNLKQDISSGKFNAKLRCKGCGGKCGRSCNINH